MANLELLPHPVVTAIQGGLFLANAIVVKKFMVDPYLALKKKRLSRTVGAEENSEYMIKEASQLRADAKVKLEQAHKEILLDTEAIKKEADLFREDLIGKAKSTAEQQVDAAVNDIKQNLAAVMGEVPTAVTPLIDDMYQKALRKN